MQTIKQAASSRRPRRRGDLTSPHPNRQDRQRGLGLTIPLAIVRGLALLAGGRVRFLRGDAGRTLTMEDGEQFSVFRHVQVKASGEPAAAFVVRFTPAHMSVRQNIRFSLLPMLPLLGLHGFREKYWCVNSRPACARASTPGRHSPTPRPTPTRSRSAS